MAKLAVVIGRFQPIHYGHQYNIDKALSVAENVLILVGSAYNSRSIKNPFTFEERKQMIEELYNQDNVYIEPIGDFLYEENQWITEVQDIVSNYAKNDIAIIGHYYNESSYYLNMFPNWNFIDTGEWPSSIETTFLNNFTDLYIDEDMERLVGLLPYSSCKFLEYFKNLDEYKFLENEKYLGIINSLTELAISVHAVVIQSGHILLLKREMHPGKDLWTLPGTFLDINNNQTLKDTIITELREKNKLKVPVPVLNGSIIKSKLFDSPDRGLFNRYISQVFYIQLKNDEELPKVKNGKWIPLLEFYDMESEMYEDYYHIIKKIIDNE